MQSLGKRKKDYCSSKNSKVYREDKGQNKIIHIKNYENVINDFTIFLNESLNSSPIKLNDYLKKFTLLILNKERFVGNEQIILKLDEIIKVYNLKFNILNVDSEFDSTRRFNLLYTGNTVKNSLNEDKNNNFFSIYIHLCRGNDEKYWIQQIIARLY